MFSLYVYALVQTVRIRVHDLSALTDTSAISSFFKAVVEEQENIGMCVCSRVSLHARMLDWLID